MVAVLALALMLIVALAHAGVAYYLADLLTAPPRRRVAGTPADLGLRYEEIQFLTTDWQILHGWFLESPGARGVVVIVHDAGGTRADERYGLLELHREYLRRGFNVFSFDLRAHGESTGNRASLGHQEKLDVRAAIAYVQRRCRGMPLLLHGFGLGGALALAHAASDATVTAVIADSPIGSMRDVLERRHHRVPGYLMRLAYRLAALLFGADVNGPGAREAAATLTIPMLFIHATGDDEVPVSHSHNLAAASLSARVTFWELAGAAGHCGGYRESPRHYMERCMAFVDDVVPARVLQSAAV